MGGPPWFPRRQQFGLTLRKKKPNRHDESRRAKFYVYSMQLEDTPPTTLRRRDNLADSGRLDGPAPPFNERTRLRSVQLFMVPVAFQKTIQTFARQSLFRNLHIVAPLARSTTIHSDRPVSTIILRRKLVNVCDSVTSAGTRCAPCHRDRMDRLHAADRWQVVPLCAGVVWKC